VRPSRDRLTARPRSGRLGLAWRLATAAAIVAFGLSQIDLDAVADAVVRLSLPLAALSWALLLAGQVVSGLRWGVIADRIGSRAARAWFVRAYLRGCFYNVFLPTGIGGDAMRIAVLRHELGLREAGRSVVLDRASGLAAIALAAAACLPFTPYLDRHGAAIAIGLAGLAAAVAAAVWLFRRGLGAFVGWTLLFELVWFAGIWTLARALGLELDAATMPIVTLIVAVAIALPLSIGGTGTREAGFVVALAPLGVATEEAVALGICFGVILALVGVVGAPLPVAPETAPKGGQRAQA
jgi:glycosyltransferase 2 family protein